MEKPHPLMFSKVCLLPPGTLPDFHSSYLSTPAQREGTWILLDKPGGKPIALPASISFLPPDAMVELKRALPYGMILENHAPVDYVDRTIPARDFTLVSLGKKPHF